LDITQQELKESETRYISVRAKAEETICHYRSQLNDVENPPPKYEIVKSAVAVPNIVEDELS
jgi:hypothetical protein